MKMNKYIFYVFTMYFKLLCILKLIRHIYNKSDKNKEIENVT